MTDRAYRDRLLLQTWKGARNDPQAPPEVLESLQDAITSAAASGMLLKHNLYRILDAFETAGIESCVLKGIALSQRLYGDPLARESNDIDLLIRRRDKVRAEQILSRLDFYIDREFAEGHDHHLSFFRDVGETKVHLELHVAVNYGNRRSFPADWWEARVPIRVGPKLLHIFRDDHLLVFLCAHAAVHGYASLGWLVDIAALLPQLTCSAEDVITAARDAKQIRAVYHTVSLLRSMGTLLDTALLTGLKPHTDRTWLIRALLFRGPRTNTQFCHLISILAMAGRQRGWFLPPLKEFRRAYPHLSPSASGLLYVPWLCRGIAKAGTGLLKAGLGIKR